MKVRVIPKLDSVLSRMDYDRGQDGAITVECDQVNNTGHGRLEFIQLRVEDGVTRGTVLRSIALDQIATYDVYPEATSGA